MLYWAAVFFIIAIIAAVFGFGALPLALQASRRSCSGFSWSFSWSRSWRAWFAVPACRLEFHAALN